MNIPTAPLRPRCLLGRFLPKLGGAAKRRHFFWSASNPATENLAEEARGTCGRLGQGGDQMGQANAGGIESRGPLDSLFVHI